MTFRGRSYKNYDKETFQNNLIEGDWNTFYESRCVKQSWAYLKNKIQNEIGKMCPLKDIKIKKQKDPWISNDLLELIHDKDDLLKQAKASNLPEDWHTARTARNLVASLVKDAKKDFLTNEIENNHDPNKFWKKIHTIFPDKPASGKINLVDDATKQMLDDHLISDYANSFFTNVGANIIRDIEFDIEEWRYNGIEYPQLFELKEIAIEDVIKEINNLKLSKPSGLDNISTKVVRDALWALSHQFTWLLNLSVRSSSIPNEWKQAKVTPIPKDGDLTDINNFAISLFCPL